MTTLRDLLLDNCTQWSFKAPIGERKGLLRMNLFAAMTRLDIEGKVPLIRSLLFPGDPDVIRAAAVRAGGSSLEPQANELLRATLRGGTPDVCD
mgnify:CR=1 FL=1